MSIHATDIFEESHDLIEHARTLSPGTVTGVGRWQYVGDALRHFVKICPDKNWLTFYDEMGLRSALTYFEFELLVRQVAAVMQVDLGLKRGQRIATLLVNDPMTVVVYFAAWVSGLTVVPVNSTEDDERVAFIVKHSSAAALFTNASLSGRAQLAVEASASSAAVILVDGESIGTIRSLNQLLPSTEPIIEIPDQSREQECLIVYTSGTTGEPKGVVLENGNLVADAESIAQWHGFTESDRAMCVLPIHHVNGIVVTIATPMVSGACLVLNRKFKAGSFWSTLAAEKCTWCSVVPTVLAFLFEANEDLKQYDLSAFRHIICGAGPLTVELAHRFLDRFNVRVVHGYGLSETTCYSCFLPVDLDEDEYRRWMLDCGFPSIGCPIPVNEMAIHDSSGNPLGEDLRGEIVCRGINVMRWYFQRPEANRDTFCNGWFRSGDEGFYRVGRDGRNYFFITGRLKELFIRGGVNYSPFDIDEVLNAIPGVRAAMAVGFENNFYGEEIGAYVQREPGSELTEQHIIAECRKSLPYSKCPKIVLFGDTFPVTSTGKYQRNKLKPLFAQWKDVQFREVK